MFAQKQESFSSEDVVTKINKINLAATRLVDGINKLKTFSRKLIEADADAIQKICTELTTKDEK